MKPSRDSEGRRFPAEQQPSAAPADGSVRAAAGAVHARSFEEVLGELDAKREGLSSEEAARRLEAVGPNRLPDAPQQSGLVRVLKHFNDVLIYILLLAVAVVVTALLVETLGSVTVICSDKTGTLTRTR